MIDFKLYIEGIENIYDENVIYALSDPNTNEIRYIGKAKKLITRIKNHYKESKLIANTHKNNWIKCLLKNGQRVNVSVIEHCEKYEYLNEAEINWIAYFKSCGCDLTNGTSGGDGGQMSDESIEKMRLKKIGKKLSEEHKNKISKFNIGRIVSDETRKKIGKAHKGKVVSDETKKKLSDSHKGQTAWNKGKKSSEETRKKLSIINKGKKLSEETIEKIRNSQLGNKHSLGRKDSEFTKNKKAEIHKKSVKHTTSNEVFSSVKECRLSMKISSRAFYKMVKEKIIIYI